MKKLYTILVALFITATTFAQAPEKMSYQAVIRDSGGALVTNQAVGIQISILQTAVTGTAVYIETQTPTTNTNGLVTLEIGTGTVITGSFNSIEWDNGPYFVKTETDPTGGTNYTITGTTQLMSVPYALHAKTAESITGTVTYAETDPVFTAWDKSTGISITESQISDLTHTVYTAGSGIDITGNVISTTQLSIGDSYQGGIIFWLDTTGQHGLIAATTDHITEIQWYNGTNTTTNAVRDGVYAGKYNTERIIATQGVGAYPAQLCANYQGGNYGDWYLPSKYELNLLYAQKTVVGGFANSYYWSSTEVDDDSAWVQSFVGGSQFIGNKSNTDYVRAVRAF